MIPDYAKGKESAIRILKLNKRRSKIDPNDTSGVVLVRRDPLMVVKHPTVDLFL